MRFGILGPLEVRAASGEPLPVPERKVRALLARLLTEPGRAVPVGRLIDDLWGGREPADPKAALQTKVSQLRRVLAGGEARIERLDDSYRLAVPAAAIDAEAFEALVRDAARAGAAERANLLESALALWRGAALAEYDALAAAAARLEGLRLTAHEDLLRARIELGRYDSVLAESAGLIERHPLREGLWWVHMRALYCSGRHSEALDAYRELRERLSSELGLEPGREARELHRAMLRHDPALAPAPEPAPGNLPAQLTALIGRDGDLRRLQGILEGPRLVTLTGPGGVGKTRLASGAAAAAPAPDGVWFIELACYEDAADAEEIAAGIAETMGLVGAAPRVAAADPFALLRSALDRKRTLLVMDNCEHLIGAAAELCARLLADAPAARVLATSREPLRIPGEQVVPVEPLDADSAVRLFAARASDAQPGFAVTEANAAAVAAVCARLDGLPLALELAATRVPALGVEALARQITDLALGVEARGLHERQRTLRAVIDWSWRLLGPDEQLVLRRLSVPASAALDTVQALCAGDLTEAGTTAALANLVDRSLVHVAGEAERRYRLLDTVAAYGRERLREAGEHERVADLHGRHFTELAERSATALRGPGQRRWLKRLDADTANLHTALDAAVRLGEAERALRLALGLVWFRFLRGGVREGTRSLQAALAVEGAAPSELIGRARFWLSCFETMTTSATGHDLSEAPKHIEAFDDPGDRARAQLFLALTQIGVSENREAEGFADESAAYFAAAGDRWGGAAADSAKAWFALLRGELDLAWELASRGRAAFKELGDGWGELQALECLAVHAEGTGDYETARRINLEGLAITEDLELRMEESYRLSRLGRVEMLRGEFDRSRALHRRALAMAVEHSVGFCEMFAATGLMLLERRSGRLGEAERIAREWLAWVSGPPALKDAEAMLLGELGFIAEQRGDGGEALRLHREALAVLASGEFGDRTAAPGVEGVAGAWSLLESPEAAAVLLGGAAALRERAGVPLPSGERFDVDRVEARIVEALGRAAFDAAFARGRLMGAEGVLSLAATAPGKARQSVP